MMRATSILLASILVGVLGRDGSIGCGEGESCTLPGSDGTSLIQKAKKSKSTEDKSLEAGRGGKGRKGRKAVPKEPAWVTAVPDGLNKVENWDKEDCHKTCLRDWGKLEVEGWTRGYCDYCGKGNACCKWNDPLAPDECSGVDEEPYKTDKYGYITVSQLTYKCVYPKKSNYSNYEKYKDEAMEAALKMLSGQGGGPPTMKSQFSAPEVEVDGYTSIKGKGQPSYFLAAAVEKKDDVKEFCPAFGDPKYALSNSGLFDDMTYYSYPFAAVSGSELTIKEFCGAKYTDDASEETQQAAAQMAMKACDDMGDKCGGYSVGADPECCGNTGCTEVVFLGSAAKAALTNEDDVINKRPPSFKTGEYACNFYTYIKNSSPRQGVYASEIEIEIGSREPPRPEKIAK